MTTREVTGWRAWLGTLLIRAGLRVVYGRAHGRDLTLTFNEEP